MRNASFKSLGLSAHQVRRLAACAAMQRRLNRPVCVDDLAEEFETGPELAGLFLRSMVGKGYLEESYRPEEMACRRCRFYTVTRRWRELAKELEDSGRFPGLCCLCESPNVVSFTFLGRFFCRECLMLADRSDLDQAPNRQARSPRRRPALSSHSGS